MQIEGLYLVEKGIIPDAIVGDFDSVTEEEWHELHEASLEKLKKFQAEKDETDTDLALLKALTYKPTEIVVTGVTGGRLDHYEAALRSIYHLQLTFIQKSAFKIMNQHNEIQIFNCLDAST